MRLYRPGWLPNALKRARAVGWCMKPYCTTCGAFEFRGEMFRLAYTKIRPGTVLEFRTPRELFDQISQEERDKTFIELVSELKRIESTKNLPCEGLRVLIIDLDAITRASGNPRLLDQLLGNCPANNFLALMRAHSEQIALDVLNREQQEAKNHARKLLRKTMHSIQKPKPIPRDERVRKGTGEIHDFLRRYESETSSTRLLILSDEYFMFTLDVVPRESIPNRSDVAGLSLERRNRLALRIDKRRGKWGSLKNVLLLEGAC